MDNSIPKLLGVLAIVATSAGCMVHARATANAEADAPVTYASRPTLVAVGSGVWVVRASAHATYYVSDSYWCYREGVWYRSSSYSGGWATVQVSAVPTVIVNGNHSVYVNYQGSATAQTMPAPGSDVVASNDTTDKSGKKEKDELPGVGNKRKAAGDQPGTVGKGLTKDKDPDPPKASPPSAEASPKAEKKAEKAEAKAEKAEAKAEKKDDNAGKKK